MKIEVFNVKGLRVEDDFGYLGFVKRKLTLLPLADSAAGYTVGLKEAANKFSTAVDELDKVLEPARNLPSTKEATQKDEDRDKAWNAFRRIAKATKGHPNKEIADFAVKTEEIFLRYGDMLPLAQQEETARIDNLVQDLKALDTTKMTQAGFTPFLTDLEQKQTAYVAISDTQSSEHGHRMVGVIKQKRTEADAAYRRLVETVNALVVVNGETAYKEFVLDLNGRIDQNKAMLANRRTIAEKKKKPADPKDPKDPKQPKEPKAPDQPKEPKQPEKPGGGAGEQPKKPDEKPKEPKKPGDDGNPDITLPEE